MAGSKNDRYCFADTPGAVHDQFLSSNESLKRKKNIPNKDMLFFMFRYDDIPYYKNKLVSTKQKATKW